MIASILIGLTLILSTFISTASIVQKFAYAQARMEPSINGVSVPNFLTQRSIVVGSNNEPGRNFAVQGAGGAPSSHGPSITNGPQIFAQASQYSRTETPPSTASQLGIAHAQRTQGGWISMDRRDPEFAAALSSNGMSITNGPQVLVQGIHSVDISKVIQKIAIVAGLGFIVASFYKFHQHRQNPQQVQMGIALLLSLHLFPFL
ncbi:MAG TPA: hypothetical protein VEH06_06175 [Candidatus Bathyarchaeia archaeon]|nr:hypothetical protein [Candidatus Bathyarchaeia archaeon]